MGFHLNFMLSATGPQDQFTYLKMETRILFLLIISVKALSKTQEMYNDLMTQEPTINYLKEYCSFFLS